MSGGILQLVAKGIQDVYIESDPEVTFFKTVYRRHVNFSRTEIDLKFINKLDFGREGLVRIGKFGDLLHRLFLSITLPKIDITFQTFTIGEVKSLLLECNIVWYTDLPDDTLFTEEIYYDTDNGVKKIVDDAIIRLEQELENVYSIIDLLNTELAPSMFYEVFPDGTVDQYERFVFDRLIDFDQYAIEYKLILAQLDDIIDDSKVLVNSIALRDLLFEDFILFATDVLPNDPDPASFNDENLIFLYNTETANYLIGGSLEQLTSDTVFRTGIENTYPDGTYTLLDAYKIFNSTLITGQSNINSFFDIQVIRDLLLNNIRYGLIKNPKQLVNVYNSLDDDFKFTFYKKLTRTAPNIFNATDDFINLSQIDTAAEIFYDNFTNDFKLIPEVGEPSNVSHPYGNDVKTFVNNFHVANRNVHRTAKFIDYFNNYTLWTRTNVASPGNTDLDDFENLCQIEILNLFGEIPTALIRMYFLNYIPLLTANDIPIAIERFLNNKIIKEGDANNDISNYLPPLLLLLNATKNILINTLLPYMCLDDNFNTQVGLSSFKNNTGENGDIIIHSIIRHALFLPFGGTNLTFPEYVVETYKEIINSFTSNGFDDEKQQLLDVIGLFATSSENMITHTTYINQNFNQNTLLPINNSTDPVLSDAISSIWYNIVTTTVQNYNTLYDQQLLGLTNFGSNVGSEMQRYLNEIMSNFFNINSENNSINYWFDTDHSILPVNDLGGGIGEYLGEKISIFESQQAKYDRNRKLLNMRNIVLPRINYYFTLFNDILNKYINDLETIIESDSILDPPLLYFHQNHDEIDDPVIAITNQYIVSSDKPRNNARDITELIEDIFIDLVTEITNPFDNITEPNKYQLWSEIRTSGFDREDELTKYLGLFNRFTGNTGAQELFKFNTTIEVVYNGFVDETNVYNFMKDYLINRSILSGLLSIKGNTVEQSYENYLNFYSGTIIVNGVTTTNPDAVETQLIQQIDKITNELTPTLENALKGGETANFAWIQKLGHYIIEYINIYMCGQLIDKQYGEWMNIWHELTMDNNKERIYKELIGDIEELTTFDRSIKQSITLYIPLQFWFCRNIGNALPLISMNHTNVDIKIKLRQFDEVAYFDDFTKFKTKPKLECKLLAEYIYVEKSERTRLVKDKLEYLIDTIQYSSDDLITSINVGDDGISKKKLYFKNGCRELYWVFQDISLINGSRSNGERIYHQYYLNDGSNPIFSTKIEFNNRDRELFKEAEFYNWIQPYQHHTSIPPIGIHTYSLAISPETVYPSGQANFSKLEEVAIIIKLKDEVIVSMSKNNLVCRFAVYGLFYNILRVMSGLTGLNFYQ